MSTKLRTPEGGAPKEVSGGLDVAAIRGQFPILEREIHPGKRLSYLDSAATSLKPECVIESITEHYRWHTANVHRGVHRLAEEATEAYEAARARVARFVGARADRQIIFTHGATESINLVAWTWARQMLRRGDEIVVTDMEHHANLVPWQRVAAERGAELRFIPLTADGRLDLSAAESLIEPRTRLVALPAVSNVLGTVNPVHDIVSLAHAAGARVLVDGAQSVPHMATNVAVWDCDFLAFSSHKMCGPEGVGVLYGKEDALEEMPPFMAGGEMVRRVRRTSADWNEVPWKFEAGTPPIGPAIGMGVAAEFLTGIGLDAIRHHDIQLVTEAMERLSEVDGLRILGPAAEHRSGLVSFTIEGVHPHDLAQVLDSHGVAIRAGHHCAQPLHTLLGIPASARASFYLYNTAEEIDRLMAGIEDAIRLLRS